MAGKPEEQKSI